MTGHRLEEIGVATLAHVQESVARAADAPNWLRDHHAEEHVEGEPGHHELVAPVLGFPLEDPRHRRDPVV